MVSQPLAGWLPDFQLVNPDMESVPTPITGDSYQALFEKCGDALLVMRDNRFLDCNQAAVDLFGYDSKEAILQREPWETSPEFQPDGLPSMEKQQQHLTAVLEKGTHRFEWDHVRADGSVFPVEVVLTLLHENEGTYLHVSLRDLTERRQLERELSELREATDELSRSRAGKR